MYGFFNHFQQFLNSFLTNFEQVDHNHVFRPKTRRNNLIPLVFDLYLSLCMFDTPVFDQYLGLCIHFELFFFTKLFANLYLFFFKLQKCSYLLTWVTVKSPNTVSGGKYRHPLSKFFAGPGFVITRFIEML